MDDVLVFAIWIGRVCLVLLLAVLSNRLSRRVGVPAPAVFLVAAAVVSHLVPEAAPGSIADVQRVVTVALVVILFSGGMSIGWSHFRANATAITWVGVAGTLVTAGALALAAHALFGYDWRLALLIGTALSPTDPAVVFSVLGQREIAGRSGILLEGESGANDPVGIALMVALVAVAGETGAVAVRAGVEEFALQLGVGGVMGYVGGRLLLVGMRRVVLPSEALYPIMVLAGAGLIYSLTTIMEGSGFLAVFVAGILVGDERAPYKREIERFHAVLAGLGEIVTFTLLGLTLDLDTLRDGDAWLIGLGLALLMTLVIRPVLVGLVLLPVRLERNERHFMAWAGLKGAVPILLGSYILATDHPQRVEAYDVVFVVVVFSVMVQGGMVPWIARFLRLPVRVVEQEPWSLGVRFRDEPHGLHRYVITEGATADGAALESLPLGEDAWVSLVDRDGALIQIRGDTVLRAGDQVLVLAEPEDAPLAERLFTLPPDPSPTPAAG